MNALGSSSSVVGSVGSDNSNPRRISVNKLAGGKAGGGSSDNSNQRRISLHRLTGVIGGGGGSDNSRRTSISQQQTGGIDLNNDDISLDFIVEVDNESSDDNTDSGDVIINNIPGQTDEPIEEEVLNIGSKENQDVTVLRLVAFSVLMLSAIACGVVVFKYVNGSENLKFENQFKQNVHKVFGSMGSKIENTFASIDAFATSIVSHVAATNQTWPYILIQDFPIRAAKTRAITLGIFIETAVLVQPNQRLTWESYAWANRGWVNQSLVIQKTDPNFYGPSYWNTTTTQSIYSDEGDIPYSEM
jgi:hypothetical protein